MFKKFCFVGFRNSVLGTGVTFPRQLEHPGQSMGNWNIFFIMSEVNRAELIFVSVQAQKRKWLEATSQIQEGKKRETTNRAQEKVGF